MNSRHVARAGASLAFVLVAVKATFLGMPAALTTVGAWEYLRALAAISYADVLFAGIVWMSARVLLWAASDRRAVVAVAVVCSAIACSYAVASVEMFDVFGGFLTYSLVRLTVDVRMLRDAALARLTPGVVVAVPIFYVILIRATASLSDWGKGHRALASASAFSVMALWVGFGHHVYATSWATRQEHRIAENPHWVLISSSWRAMRTRTVRMDRGFDSADLSDFEPTRRSAVEAESRTAVSRLPNIILIVLESVGARWTSVNGGRFDTTPTLKAESASAAAFDNMYAHVGRSSASLPALLLSVYPKLDFQDLTVENPHLPGTSLASVFRHHGYHTVFMTPADLAWGGWDAFLQGRGFDDIQDYRRMACGPPISSWGVEDRCLSEAMIDFIDHDRARPFFLMTWTVQTHYPYEPTPGVDMLDLAQEPTPDEYDLERYLNVLHETDRHLGRLFDAIRRAGLAEDTAVIVTGDHGQAFGTPHRSYAQGVTAYEEDVHVPLLIWSPRKYRSVARSDTIGSHIDLAPTLVDLAGIPSAPDWQGRSLFDQTRVPRAYFYVAEDGFVLGVRENQWKYIFDLRTGVDELYDLGRDLDEQRNLAAGEVERCARLRQRLAAWMEANRRQYRYQ